MIVGWLAIGVVAGYLVGVVAIPRLARRPPGARVTIREAGDAAPRTRRLDELIEAASAAALRIRIRPNGFDVRAQSSGYREHVVAVRVEDAARVTLASLQITDTGGYDLIFTLALALVPLYGPLTIAEADGQRFQVDGTRDQHELRHERAARVTARLRDVVSRLQ
jgi:hypothetical protein